MSHPTSDHRVVALSNVPPAQAPAVAAAGFDYAALPLADAEDLRDRAGRLRGLLKKHTADIVVIGRDLIAVKDRLAHGQFEIWIERELGVGIRAAQYYMSVARFTEGKGERVSLLPPASLRILAAKSAPQEIVEQIIARAASGEIVADVAIKTMIANDKVMRQQAKSASDAAKRKSKEGRAARN